MFLICQAHFCWNALIILAKINELYLSYVSIDKNANLAWVLLFVFGHVTSGISHLWQTVKICAVTTIQISPGSMKHLHESNTEPWHYVSTFTLKGHSSHFRNINNLCFSLFQQSLVHVPWRLSTFAIWVGCFSDLALNKLYVCDTNPYTQCFEELL